MNQGRSTALLSKSQYPAGLRGGAGSRPERS